jgi:SAM-dependent methyltransferase
MRSTKEFFEEAYDRTGRYWWDVPYAYSTSPDEMAPSLLGQATLRLALSRSPGRAIDLGSGEGADAIRLARLGWHVEAVEFTSAGCDKIRSGARSVDVSVTIHQADLDQFETNDVFDIVLCNGVLHYMPDKASACVKLQGLTAQEGVNVISLWSDHSPVPACHTIVPVYPDAERGTVYGAYSRWAKELLYFERAKAETGHDDMVPRVHSYIKMVTRREET